MRQIWFSFNSAKSRFFEVVNKTKGVQKSLARKQAPPIAPTRAHTHIPAGIYTIIILIRTTLNEHFLCMFASAHTYMYIALYIAASCGELSLFFL